jgi:TPR repeat protein
MSELNEPAPAAPRNPLMWITLIVIGLILFVFLNGDREDALPRVQIEAVEPVVEEYVAEGDVAEGYVAEEYVAEEYVAEDLAAGTIERTLMLPPGMRARQYIQQLRSAGTPYPLSQVFDKAQKYRHEGSLADAHLLYFFAARESHLPSLMMMAEMSDPLLFRAENSLLDQADAIQAFKWYRMAAELGQPGVDDRLEALRGWANDAAATGNSQAEQLLLSIQ